MIIDNNFISIVFLGNFNPAILNKDFLEKYNILKFDEEPIIKYSPIFSNINYKNLNIIIDLDRFQIIESKINDFSKNIVINFAYSYLNILKYTPIRTAGINMNIDVKIINIKKFLNIIDGKELLELFKVKDYRIRTDKKINVSKEEFENFNLSYVMAKDKLVQIGIKKNHDNIFKVNYNNEVRSLDKNIDNKLYIKENFNKILEMFYKTTKILFDV